MENNENLFGKCPYATSQKILSGKWALLVLYHLTSEKVLRFNELERKLRPITQATLTKQLRTLEGYGVICRKVYGTIPPKVEYYLSDLGKEFIPVINSLGEWGMKWINQMNLKESTT